MRKTLNPLGPAVISVTFLPSFLFQEEVKWYQLFKKVGIICEVLENIILVFTLNVQIENKGTEF